ncbi:MAG TPA: asparagine synthase-related protein, partial [Gemmatimonadaceae bacterium]|nr:asparagine synthase-related protein [Gemmatimonadaceae bacterium]
ERVAGRDHKLLLREAMRDWLPESVVSDRPRRTGHNRDYVSWALSREAPQVVRVLGDRPVLADLGIVVAGRLSEVSAELGTGEAAGWFAGWSFTVSAEAWLRGRR